MLIFESVRQVKGRLRVCSKSIFFEPNDIDLPIVRYEFSFVKAIDELKEGLIAKEDKNSFYIHTLQTVEMKENNVIGPYKFVQKEVIHRFTVKYASVKTFLAEVSRLHALSKVPPYEAEVILNKIADEKIASITFDMTWLESFDERVQLEIFSKKVSPLTTNPGRLMLTNKILYFQSCNDIDSIPVEKFSLRNVRNVIKRRHELRPIGLEIFLNNENEGYKEIKSVLFAFNNQKERDIVYDKLIAQEDVKESEIESIDQIMNKWRCGIISNFEYLMYLNSQTHRSFNDLTQYPIFPWIIADYKSKVLDLTRKETFRDLSKPIGALNEDRLRSFTKRYNEMPDGEEKFLYGTHYSTPAYVLYYLVRTAPEYMLKLQNGKFDEPDRIFHSIQDTWYNVLNNPADLKELIPEFFVQSEFLKNKLEIDFGMRHDNVKIDNVALPPWCKDAEDFIEKNREALESDYVSENLHEWIDLIFGYKQRGEAAIAANNVFHPLTYEGAVDLDKIHDPKKKHALLVQINEFGQTPKQIFFKPHPKRLSRLERQKYLSSDKSTVSTDFITLTSPISSPLSLSPQPELSFHDYRWNKPNPQEVTPKRKGSIPISRKINDDVDNKMYGSITDFGVPPMFEEVSFSFIDEIEFIPSSSLKSSDASEYINDDFNNEVFLTDSSEIKENFWGYLNFITERTSVKLHKDSITSMCTTPDKNYLFTVSQDSTLKMYSLTEYKPIRSINISQLALSSCVYSLNQKNVIVGSWDNNIYMYSTGYGRIVDTLYGHDDAVSSIALRDDNLVSGSWDSTIKLWRVLKTGFDKVPLCDFTNLESEVNTVDIDKNSRYCLSGSNDGLISLIDLRSNQQANSWQLHNSPVSCVKFMDDGKVISTAINGGIIGFDLDGGTFLNVKSDIPIKNLCTNGDKVIVAGDSNNLEIWSINTGKVYKKIQKQESYVSSILVEKDLNTMLVGGDDGYLTFYETK